jgi:hypothetical protein
MPKTEPAFRPLAATAFWVSLFGAAGLFAALALAPKLRTYRELSRDYDTLQRRLVSTEHRTERLAKVADALEHDAQFAAELARVDFDTPGAEERIPVGPQLSLPAWDANPASADIATRPSSAALLDGPFLDTLSDDRGVRTPLMAASSLLVLVAVALCGERRPRRAEADPDATDRGVRGWLARRYGRADR